MGQKEFREFLKENTQSELDEFIEDLAMNKFSICPIDQEFYSFKAGIKYAIDNIGKLKSLNINKRELEKDLRKKLPYKESAFSSCTETGLGKVIFVYDRGLWYDEDMINIKDPRIKE